jgi:hypothetical protein
MKTLREPFFNRLYLGWRCRIRNEAEVVLKRASVFYFVLT